jgi:DNA-binding transcriptional LysR family regulator
VRIGLEMGSRESVREAVAQGLGLGVVASNAYVPDERLAALPIEGAALHTHPHAICLRERQAVPLVASFLDVVAEALAAKAAAARMLQGKSTSHPHAP